MVSTKTKSHYPALTILLLIACFSHFTGNLHAQSSKTFWFVAPDLASTHEQSPIVLRLINGNNTPVTVTISEPSNPSSFTPVTLTIPANSLTTYDLSNVIYMVENKPANTINNYGILITSNQYISAYYEENGSLNPNIYTLKGDNALGTSFIIPGQNFLDNYPGYEAYNSINIVATQDNTIVTITPKQDIVGHSAGSTFTVNLNKGQTYAAVAVSQLKALHLGGSVVTSNKPVAITVCDDTMQGTPFGGCGNQGGDQIVPVALTGTTYIAVRGFLSYPGDQIFITSVQPNTNVYINGNSTPNGTIAGVGGMYRYSMDTIEGACSIRTDKNVYVMQMSGTGCEVGLPLLPQLKCTGSRSVTIARTTNDNFFCTVLVEAGGEEHFTIVTTAGTGATLISNDFKNVPGTGGSFKYARKQFSTTEIAVGAVFTVSNSTNKFHLGIIQTTHGGAKVGYFSDFASSQAKFDQRTMSVCKGSPVNLHPNVYVSHTVAPGSVLYSWDVPNGSGGRLQTTPSNSASSYLIPSATTANSGDYIVHVDADGCAANDTITISVVNPPAKTNVTTSVCSGGLPFRWNGKDYNSAGVFTDTLTTAIGCDSIVTLTLTVKQPVSSTINASLCAGEKYTINGTGYTTPGTYQISLKTTAGCDSIINLTLTSKPKSYGELYKTACNSLVINGQTYNVSGNYQQTLSNAVGCDSILTLHLTVLKATTGSVTAKSCDPVTLNGQTYTASGTYQQTLTNSVGCDSILTINFTRYQLQTSTTKAGFCKGDPYTFNGNTYMTAGTYQINLKSTNGCDSTARLILTEFPTYTREQAIELFSGETYSINGHVYDREGDYSDLLKTENGCDSLVITHLALTIIPNTISPNDDGINDTFMKGYHVKIYNRNGLLLFEGDDGWDGKYKGRTVAGDTYFYALYYRYATEQKIKEGYITVAGK
jgi:gliding motility-associated-like protein